MTTSLLNIIPIVIQIEEKLSRLYLNVAVIDGKYNHRLRTVALVLSRQICEHTDYYKSILDKFVPEEFSIDDKLFKYFRSSLNDFKQSISRDRFENLSELYEYAIIIEKNSIIIMNQIRKAAIPEVAIPIMDNLITIQENNIVTISNYLSKESQNSIRN